MNQPNNPYAAPQTNLVESLGVEKLEGWSSGRLQLLGYLNLVSALGSVLVLGLALAAGFLEDASLQSLGDWLSPALTLLGCYLLIQLKLLAEQRFAAQQLHKPVWAVVLCGLLLMLLNLLWGDAATGEMGWRMFSYLGVIAGYGALLAWLGFRLRQVQNVYPAFRLMAWLELVGGLMLLTVMLLVLAMLPLIGASVAMAWVFFRAAAEQRGQAE